MTEHNKQTPEQEPIRVMLTDDEEGFRKALARRLTRRGLPPLEAHSGEDCLAKLENAQVDVVIMDVKMPGMGGLAALKEIRQKKEPPQVILLTGDAAISEGVEGIKSGAFDYLTKPVELEHLLGKIHQAGELIRLEKKSRAQSQYRARLEKKMVDTERLVSLGTLSTGVAHEINNPLAIINEAAALIRQTITPQESVPGLSSREIILKAVEKIEKGVRRARSITHQLLGYGKSRDPDPAPVVLEQLVGETLRLLGKEISEKQLKITWPREQSTSITTQPRQIRQVLLNLLTNAVQALEPQGEIQVSVTPHKQKQGQEQILLVIQDNGPGISQEHIGKIFDPFFTTKSFDQGTGLGLFVVHKIVSSLGGSIQVESLPQKGTCFSVILPIISN